MFMNFRGLTLGLTLGLTFSVRAASAMGAPTSRGFLVCLAVQTQNHPRHLTGRNARGVPAFASDLDPGLASDLASDSASDLASANVSPFNFVGALTQGVRHTRFQHLITPVLSEKSFDFGGAQGPLVGRKGGSMRPPSC